MKPAQLSFSKKAYSITIRENEFDENNIIDIINSQIELLNMCPICLDKRIDLVDLQCNHVICQKCLFDHKQFKTKMNSCPLCRKPIANDFHKNWVLTTIKPKLVKLLITIPRCPDCNEIVSFVSSCPSHKAKIYVEENKDFFIRKIGQIGNIWIGQWIGKYEEWPNCKCSYQEFCGMICCINGKYFHMFPKGYCATNIKIPLQSLENYSLRECVWIDIIEANF